jgi:uncharacterized membrane protein
MNQLQLVQVGMIVILVGLIIIVFSIFFSGISKDSNIKFSIFGLVGFIPIGFSNDKRLFFISILITLILIFFTILLFFNQYRQFDI